MEVGHLPLPHLPSFCPCFGPSSMHCFLRQTLRDLALVSVLNGQGSLGDESRKLDTALSGPIVGRGGLRALGWTTQALGLIHLPSSSP